MNHSEKKDDSLRIVNIAFYRFVQLKDYVERRAIFKQKCQEWGLKGTILLSPEGINGFLAGERLGVDCLKAFLDADPVLSSLEFKETFSDEIPFEKLFIKLKKEIIPIGDPSIQPELETAPRISPQELKKWLDENKEINLIDTRNNYEVEEGTFKSAITFDMRHFRKFPEKLKSIPEIDKKRPTVMFCTGGIRCEKATVVAMRQGFDEVYQLDGGILKYFKECGGVHYDGKCFVFDERGALDSDLK